MKHHLIAAALAFGGLAQSAFAEDLAEHTFLIAWASKNCEGFSYAPDLLRHAVADVQAAPEEAVNAMGNKIIGGLHALHNGDKAEICETAIFLIENPEED